MATAAPLLMRLRPMARCAILSALVLVSIGLVYELDALPGRDVFATSRFYTTNRRPIRTEGGAENPSDSCAVELNHLKSLHLTDTIRHSRRCVRPLSSVDVDRDIVTNISSHLLTKKGTLDLSDACTIDVGALPCDPLELPVPPAYPTNHGQFTHLTFGVATTFARLLESKSTFAHWLSDSGSTLVGLLTDDSEELGEMDPTALEEEYGAEGMNLILVPKHRSEHTTEQSHVMIIRDMLKHARATGKETHWLGIIDDDTFFPSLHALASAFAQYDHTKPQYLGQLTESAHIVPIGILGGFGGAGIFLSWPLAQQLEPHLESCLEDFAKLKMVEGLYQMDIMGDTAGFYESSRRVLSLHHWKSWHWSPVDKMAAITKICGGCFLQRFAFLGNGNEAFTILNNGYSINIYRADLEEIPDLSLTEQTWDGGEDGAYQWSLGPLRQKVDKGKKKSYWLEAVVAGENGTLTQVYVHRGSRKPGEYDEVIELVWQP
ncbi:hypothetical protein INS49_002196 [Diaporthe citri]|uniref:uncharacterized protein n=1 Tax=Diaporthe citri TaxID=83186 RepID=UPI001C8150EF|nr:uncharacterized protein INS49_002196 [Diaporthe citri]KAG6367996.1 hypothetical protein INS49_002196 [Diaporthe citri]